MMAKTESDQNYVPTIHEQLNFWFETSELDLKIMKND